MNRKKAIITVSLFFLLFGCGTDSNTDQNKQDTPITGSNKLIDQQPSADAKEMINKHEEISAIKAVNNSETIVVAVKVNHSERFTLKSLRKKMEKELKDSFPKLDVEFSTDLKIFLELEKLEEEIQADHFTEDKLDKGLKEIIKLSKEQT
ncbi:hypothetical protein CWR48_12555 [Oceanobacillus arenosus]|uniref:Sporulation protein n=1 Tax=Oceanobacillus arenosus TaxID=1229153 RepID=A0A3D8PT19_9BACI|nr:hypothetical protein [Oceanobacillus arenosus]RDW18398.1 hypothetical protein CWR48_12555 [Oceanobacillus arenosus]